MAGESVPPPRPLTPSPSRAPRPRVDVALERVNDLHDWMVANDPKPPWWKPVARREWQDRWGATL